MIYLLLSIAISSSLFVIFKLFDVYKINTLQAIITNYVVAFIIGYFVSEVKLSLLEIPFQPWFLGALGLGFLFIAVFNVMALTAQKNGLSVASVAGKMSVIVPVIFAITYYKDSLGIIKLCGIILALVAVYLTSVKEQLSDQRQYLIYPILLFIGSGIIDTAIKYIETTYVPEGGVPIFSATIFIFAFLFGVTLIVIKGFTTKIKFEWKNIIAGIVLGIPNYFSIDFLLRALKTEGLESSTLFTINNVSIVLLTTIFGVLLFKEKLLPKNWIGIIIAIISILLVSI